MGKKERFAFYLTPEKKALLERRYQEDGSRSMTAFVERAVDFYLDYLSANDAGLFLPTSIKSYLDGRLGQLEERLSSLAFRQAVAVLPGLPAGGGAGHGGRYPRRRLSIQRRGSPPPEIGERAKCEKDQRPCLAGAAGTWGLGGGR